MTDASESKWWVGRLDLNPGVAGMLGVYFGEVAVLEFHMIRLFSMAIGEPAGPESPLAEAAFTQIQSVALRLDITKATVAKSALPEADKLDTDAFIERARTINARRNVYAHGLFETHDDTGEVRVTPFFSLASRRREHETLTIERIHQDVLAVRKLSSEIMKRFHPDQIQPYPAEAGTAAESEE